MGSKRDPPQTSEKTSSSRTSRVDEPDTKKSTFLKVKVDRPKKDMAEKDQKTDASREKKQDALENVQEQEFDNREPEKQPRKEIKKEIDKKKVKRVIIDESDEEKSERDEINGIWEVLCGLKENSEYVMNVIEVLIKENGKLNDMNNNWKERFKYLEKELKVLKGNEREYLIERELTKKKVNTLEEKWETSQEELEQLRDNFQNQLDSFQPAGKADESWKGVEENMMSELTYVKNKLNKRIKKDEVDKVILNLHANLFTDSPE